MRKTLLILIPLIFSITSFARKPEAKTNRNVSATGFIENKGQIIDQNNNPNPAVKYLYHGKGLNVQLRANGFSYDTYTIEKKVKQKSKNEILISEKLNGPDEVITYHFHRIDVNLIGANLNPTIIGAGASEAYFNYFTAGTPKGGVSNVHSFQQVTYQNIYPNIDLQFICDEKKGFKYNFIVHPGADYAQIKLLYNGTDGIKLLNGEILIPTLSGNVTENIPLSYLQENNEEVNVNYKTTNLNEFSFQVNKNYNTANTLIIDPTPNLVWGTYYGGTGTDYGYDIVVDPSNNVYITGETTSNLSMATAGAYQTTYAGTTDAFVAEFNSSGSSLLWGTYYGGTGNDSGYGIALDVSNNLYITGSTNSTLSIATGGAYQTTAGGGGYFDAFIAKFNSTGTSLLWGTYYGGTSDEYSYSIALDANANVYITGNTSSTLSIATGGAYQTTLSGPWGFADTFVAKFNSAGSSLLWGTYYGAAWGDYARDIALDASNNVYITGYTTSGTGLATAGAYQTTGGGAFVAKFNSNGSSLLWGTYYGGPNGEGAFGIALDVSNNVYITGDATSTIGVATVGAYQTTFGGGSRDAFVAKFNPSGSALLWGTYYGGTNDDSGYSIALDASNNVYIIGNTYSFSGIATVGAYQTIKAGGGTSDLFIARFNSTGTSLLWGTYYGGAGSEWRNSGIALDASANIYVTGQTSSPSAISTVGAYQTTFGGVNYDAFIAKFIGCVTAPPQPGVISGINPVCAGITSYSVATVGSATSYSWSLPGTWTGTSLTNSISATTGSANGIIYVSAVNACGTSSAQTLSVTVNPQPTITVNSGSICSGNSFTMVPGGANTYTFQGGSATVSPTTNSSYIVIGTNTAGCTNTTVSNVSVNPTPTITVNSGSICSGNSFTILPGGANTYTFQGGSAVVSPTMNSSYTITGTSAAGCVSSNTAISNVTVNTSPTITVNSGSICLGNFFTMVPSGANTYTFQGGSAIVSPTANTSYSIIGISSAGCVSSNTAISNITVTINVLPTITVNSGSICSGNSFTMVPGGANTYTIQGGSTVVSPTTNSSYTVAGTSTAGCVSANTAICNITVNITPTITVNSGSICSGGSFTIIPTGANTYTIQGGNAVVSPTTNSSYTITGANTGGCVSSATLIVTTLPLPIININGDSIVCIGSSLTQTASGASSYTWSTGDYSADVTISPSVNTIYTVSGTDLNGCINTSTVLVTVNTQSPNTVFSYPQTCVNSLTVNPILINGFTSGGSFSANNLNIDAITGAVNLSSPSAGTYIVTYSIDFNGCKGSRTENLIISPVIDYDISPSIYITPGSSITLFVNGGSNFTWAPSSYLSCTECANPIATPIENTQYCVIPPANSCFNKTCVNITVSCEGNGNFSTPNAFTPNGDNNNDLFCLQGWKNCVTDFNIKIFDRWGEKVYESDDPSFFWDGIYKGELLSVDSYVFVIRATKYDSSKFLKKGSIELIR